MDELMVAIASHPDLTEGERLFAIVACKAQTEGGKVSQKLLADLLRVSIPTVERRVRKLREYGLVEVTKVDRYTWLYDFRGFLPDVEGGNIAPSASSQQTHHAAPSLLVIFSTSLRETTVETISTVSEPADPSSSTPGENMANVDGPAGNLRDQIDNTLARSKASKTGDKFAVRKNRRREKFEAKDAAEYNANDLELVIAREWDKRGWKSRPARFTMRDRKHAKELLVEHGGEAIDKVITHVVAQWETICRRYKVNGFPSMRVIYGFRASWVPEAIDGAVSGNNTPGAEYTAKKDDIPTGSWG